MVKMRRYNLLFVCLLSFAAFSCAPRTETITIIAVNDMHGHIGNFPRLATLVERYRDADSLHTLLVDSGDRWTGNPYVDRGAERGQPMIELQNALGFDISTYGNHGFDFGLELLSKRTSEAEFRFTAANIDSNGSLLPQPEPYITLDVDGVRLTFIGLITTGRAGYPDGFVENFGSIKFSNPITAATAHRDLSKKSDVMIGLTHIGYDVDSVLATRMPELDLIIGGHSHTPVPDNTRIGNTVVSQTSGQLKYANVITVKMRGKKLASIESRAVKLDTISPDPRFTAMVESYYDRPELIRPIGNLETSLGKTGMLNMATDIIREATHSDLALYNRGGLRLDTLMAGPVKVADFYAMEPFGNMVTVLHITEEQLRGLLMRRYISDVNLSGREEVVPSGFTYHVNTDSNGVPSDVVINFLTKPGPDGTYSIATSDYLEKTYDFDGAGTGDNTGVIVSDMLMRYFEDHDSVRGDNTPRTSTGGK